MLAATVEASTDPIGFHQGPDAVDGSPKVHVEHSVPLLERELPRVTAVDDAGVAHCHVESAKMFRSELTGAVYRFRVSNVGGYLRKGHSRNLGE